MALAALPEVTVTAIIEIPLEQLEVARKNPRRTMQEADLKELAASIREYGVQVPLLVRPTHFDCGNADHEPDEFEIICGHRRSEAATLAGLTEVPCIVKELTDEQAAEIALIDNLQRVDVPPIEEADAFGELLDRLHSIAAVAAKVGKEQGYVARRLKLRDLTAWSSEALRKQLITIDHALLLARLAEDEQNEALKWCLDINAGSKTPVDEVLKKAEAEHAKTDRWLIWEPESVAELKRHIERETGVKLARAPWPLDLPDLNAKTPCNECPKNTIANAPLFGDLAIGEPTCTDGGCFKEKTAAWVHIKARAIGSALRVSWKETSKEPRMELGAPCDGPKSLNNFTHVPNTEQIFKAGQWIEAAKKCEHARPAVTIDWREPDNGGYGPGRKLRMPGEIVDVCVQPKCKVHPKAYEKAAHQQQQNSARGETEAECKAREEKRKEAVTTENQLRMGWARKAVNSTKKLPECAIREALISCLEESCDVDEEVIEKHLFPKLRKTLETVSFAGAQFAQAVAVLHIARHGLTVTGYQPDPKNQREDYIAAIKALGTDPSEAWAPKKVAIKKPAAVKAPAPAKDSILSAEARKRIAAAQKKRWAAKK